MEFAVDRFCLTKQSVYSKYVYSVSPCRQQLTPPPLQSQSHIDPALRALAKTVCGVGAPVGVDSVQFRQVWWWYFGWFTGFGRFRGHRDGSSPLSEKPTCEPMSAGKRGYSFTSEPMRYVPDCFLPGPLILSRFPSFRDEQFILQCIITVHLVGP